MKKEYINMGLLKELEGKFIKIRVKDSKGFIRFRIKDLGKGIKAVIGIKGPKSSEVQAYLFDKKRWDTTRARAWVKAHKSKAKQSEFPRSVEELPFAGYKNFADCVAKTIGKKKWKKERASAYCAAIARKAGELEQHFDKHHAELTEEGDNYILRIREDYKRLSIRPLKNFTGVDVEYGFENNNVRVMSLRFDKKKWNGKKILTFMRRYGKEVLDYDVLKEDVLFECPHVQALLDDFLSSTDSGVEKLTFDSAIVETLGEFKMPLEVSFTALKPGIFNGVYYSEEELRKGATSLKGKDLTIDHGKSVRDVVGKITEIRWNSKLEQIEGKGKIYDEEITQKVKDKLITGVSVEVMVNYFKGEHGLSAKDAEFIALSLVKEPACKSCYVQPS